MQLTGLPDTARDAVQNVGSALSDLVSPTIRLGVTGLARSGKTVFICALVRNLTAGGHLPFFEAAARGRIKRAYLEPQPDDTVPRFSYEAHLETLTGTPPAWPESTKRISQLRVTIEYEPDRFWRRVIGMRKLHLDIVDYPGEWLLDLSLLERDYAAWSTTTIDAARTASGNAEAKAWLAFLDGIDPEGPQSEQTAVEGAHHFRAFLQSMRDDQDAHATLPPGRFLLPGELADSPMLTFMPLKEPSGMRASDGSLWAMMDRRYEAYKSHVVKPFFRNHFARLDRQIVLVDALSAVNGGAPALSDLEQALEAVLTSFRPGKGGWLANILTRRIDRIVFAATKADHLHHTSHDRLEAILAGILDKAIARAQFAGAEVKVLALSALRATREAEARAGSERLPCIVGVPLAGERLDERVFDGKKEAAIFPGDLPEDTDAILSRPARSDRGVDNVVRFMRFRPPDLDGDGITAAAWPHIRLDRALDFLLGDHLT